MIEIKSRGALFSEIEALDREISNRMQRLRSGRASEQEVAEASQLIRERAFFMMPKIFQRCDPTPSRK